MNNISDLLKDFPDTPGVYLMKDKSGKIIYIGKARILKNRIRQYFQQTSEKDPKTQALVERIDQIETIITKTEAEALILENTLIKKHKPRYNILLKDDKTYPYIRITVQEPYPAIEITRRIKKDGSRYFGAYTKPSDVRRSVDLMRRIFPLRTCRRKIGKKDQRPCLYYHIGLCSGPCAGKIDRREYHEIVKEACRFLGGRQEEIIEKLEKQMQEYANHLEYEKAASLRDKLNSIRNITAKQLVLSTKMEDRDLCAMVRDSINSLVIILFVRGGKLMGKNVILLEDTYDLTDDEIMEKFATQFYDNGREIPPEILFTHLPANEKILESWLQSLRGKSVKLIQPLRGKKKDQIDLALRNAEEAFAKYRAGLIFHKNRFREALSKLQEHLKLDDLPCRIEAFDISNTGNQGMVAGMIVFKEGMPVPGHYRKFTIKNFDTQNDYAGMQEVVFRRLKRFLDLTDDDSFMEKPDVILVDGGIGHVHAVLEVLKELKMTIPVMGMGKDDKHRTRFLLNDEVRIELKEDTGLWLFISTVQEEVHRFAIRFHRHKRLKAQSRSRLDEINGIGPKRKKALLKAFGSVKRIREASVEEICKVDGIHVTLAREIKEALE